MKSLASNSIVLGLALAGFNAMALETIPAYNVYGTVPFVVDMQNTKDKGGLATDLVAYLNTKLKGKYAIELQTMPRERLNQEVISKPDFKGVVLFLNPMFVGDADKKKFAWTPAIMADKNNVISSLARKIEYVNPDSLKDMNFQAVRGNKYAGLEDRFGKDIKRADVASELQSLKLIANNKADVTIMASTVYSYLMKVNGVPDGLEGKLHVSATPHLKFDRFMFVANERADLAKDLSAVAASMPKDPEWKAVLTKYGLN